jgi:hypothetical protein
MGALGVEMQAIYRTPLQYVIGLLILASVLAYFSYREASRRKDKRKFSGTAFVACVLALSAVGLKLPSYLMDEIRFDESHMRWNAGPWWDPYEGSISLPDVKAVRVSVERGSGRRGWQQTVWHLEMKNGTVETYTVFDLWMEHYQSVKSHFVSRGIVIEDRN